jgi:uncharacterized membrane protein required for colicin V production
MMITMTFAFWACIVVFAIIGALRGWAKELLVTFSVLLALFIGEVLTRYVPPIREFFTPPPPLGSAQFWVRSVLLLILVFFGYQTPNIAKLSGPRFARERLADSLLGLFLGALNGYLIIGTLWWFLIESNYPFPKYITKPTPDPAIIAYLPPDLLGIPVIYFAIAVAFLFVIIVFI